MSLKPFSACVVPERTASVARGAFPADSLCIRIFDELGTFSRIKILPISIHNMGSRVSRRFVWPWRRFCSLLKDCRIVALPMPFAGASIGSLCYVLSWMIRVLTIRYYANFALGYLKAERNESCSTKYYRRCVIRS